ncbi:MAG: carbamoylphosphate synthase large subunit [Oscillospiraceae bacterium]|nr:carbamoylphosphate synthase large subunit [Oscillospiraceae bacterium]
MNFVFISPNFPDSYRFFCTNLKQNGVNVLGIGDAAYDELHPELKASLTEYYKVNSLENYDDVLKAVGYFTGRYGKIDWLESNNEYWLELDAALRTDFNITTGLKNDGIMRYKRKSYMKEYYKKTDLHYARYMLVTPETSLDELLAFTAQVGYPVVAKPDNGVGAIATYKLMNDDDTRAFMADHASVDYFAEEFVPGYVCTYDGVVNSKGEVLFAASHVTRNSIMDIVNLHIPMWYYVDRDIPEDLVKAGKQVLKAFDVKARCFHLEFFRLYEDKEGLGKKGELVALEVNMRPAGGYTTDMINFSQSADEFKIYADMVAYDELRTNYNGPHQYCVYIGRRDEEVHELSQSQLQAWCGDHARIFTTMHNALSTTMGNEVCVACFDTMEEVEEYVRVAFS